MCLAVAAERLLAVLALDGVLQDIVADATNQLGQEGLNMLRVVYLLLLVDELHILLRLLDDLIHILSVPSFISCSVFSGQLVFFLLLVTKVVVGSFPSICSIKYYILTLLVAI